MATNYPTGYDSLANPGANLSSAPLHSTQHTNLNDAVEAIEAELGLSPSGSDATVVARLDRLDRTGYISRALGSAATIGTSYTTLTSYTFTAVAGRRYKITVNCSFRQRTGAGIVSAIIANAADGQLGDAIQASLATDAYGSGGLTWDEAPGAGSVTYKLRGKTTANTVDFSANSYLLVEDIGP